MTHEHADMTIKTLQMKTENRLIKMHKTSVRKC